MPSQTPSASPSTGINETIQHDWDLYNFGLNSEEPLLKLQPLDHPYAVMTVVRVNQVSEAFSAKLQAAAAAAAKDYCIQINQY